MTNDTPRLNCEITRDLLPLYEEKLTAPGTARAVEAHLDECPACAALHARLAEPEPAAAPGSPAAPTQAAREVDYLKKVRKVGRLQVAVAVCLTLLVLLVGVLVKGFWIGTEATREGASWSAQWNDESQVMSLRAYTNDTGTAYRNWTVTEQDGVIRITARRVGASPLCNDTSEWFTLELAEVEEVYLFGTLLWQRGVLLFESTLDVYATRTPYVGSAAEVGEQLTALRVGDQCGPFTIQLYTDAQPYGLRLNFTEPYGAVEAKKLNARMSEIAPRLLALIDNLDYVCWSWSNGSQQYLHRISLREVSEQFDAVMTDLVAAGEFDRVPLAWESAADKRWPGCGLKWCGQTAAGYQILCDLIQEDALVPEPALVAMASYPEKLP